ncbi:MAG: type II toxin-antitoxin system PemK/MazF family toxin [Gemmatimonadaceae bacterium]
MKPGSQPPHQPSRGEVWQVALNPTRGREQSGERPAMIISVDKFDHGPADLVIVIPITKTNKNIPSHIFVPKGEGGLDVDSYIKVEDIRSISKERLIRFRGDLSYPRIEAVQQILRVLLKL